MSVEERYRRHQLRKFALLITVPGLVLGTASLAGAYAFSLLGGSAPVAACAPQTVAAPKRASFGLGIQNSTGIPGQASTVAKEYTRRGFTVLDASNAPSTVVIKSSGRIYYGPEGLDQALLVQQQVPGSELFNDGRTGTKVTLVIGDGFTALVPPPAAQTPRPAQIVVNVYNTTWRAGLAVDVQKQLLARGFAKGTIGNDPKQTYLPDDTAVIRYGPDSGLGAKVLGFHVPGAKLVEAPGLKGNTVDLVLGTKFTALASQADVPALPEVTTAPPETVTRPCPRPGE